MSTLDTIEPLADEQTAGGQASPAPAAANHRTPSQRNRRVYEEVIIGERPQEEVAKAFGISQQRVSQIVEQFQGWLAENLPADARDLQAQEQLSVAVNVAYLRCEQAMGRALRGYEASRRDKLQQRERFSSGGELLWYERLQQNQTGKIGYLNAYLKASRDELKIAQMAAGLLKIMDADGYEEPQFSALEAQWGPPTQEPSSDAFQEAHNADPESSADADTPELSSPLAASLPDAEDPLWNLKKLLDESLDVALQGDDRSSAEASAYDQLRRRKSFLAGDQNFLSKSCETELPAVVRIADPAPKEAEEAPPLDPRQQRQFRKQRDKQRRRFLAARKAG